MSRRTRSALLTLILALVAAATATSCAADGSVATGAPRTARPAATVSPAVAVVRAEIVRALGARSITAGEARAPFRPAESPDLAAAPRFVLQAVLPTDPTAGHIVIYEFPDASAAIGAAKSQHAYLSGGPGRVQDPIGTAHVLRQAGSTVIYYAWLPGAARDPLAPAIAEALATIGVGFDITT